MAKSHAEVTQLRHWILHSLSKRHFTGSLRQVKNAVLDPKCILFQMWVGEICTYWLNWKILILSCLSVVSCSLLPSCSSVCPSFQPQTSLSALTPLPSQAPSITQTPYAFVTTVQALWVALFLFSPFFICRLFVRLGHLWNRGSIFHACLLSTKSNYKKKKPSFLLPAHSAAPCDVEIITPSPEAFLVHA